MDYIYKLYMNDIYSYLLSRCKNKHIAEDIMQETFYRAYMYFESCPEDNVKSWLFTVAHNAYVDYVRKNSKNDIREKEYFGNLSDDKSLEKEVIIQDELFKVREIIKTMKDKQRKAIILCDFKGLSYKEASQVMGVSLSYFKVLVFRARKIIRDKVEGDGMDE
nr:sigma-70 family RNA polymerase sigma factor [Anaeromonas frigoriresistens]